jgi:CheY-like chemotaxis protein
VIARRIVNATEATRYYSFSARSEIAMNDSYSAGSNLAYYTGVTRHRFDLMNIRTHDAGSILGTLSPDTMPVILVAEDSSDIRAVLTMLLEGAGYSVVGATDGQDALEIALERDIDLILLDIAMPRLTGTAFCLAYRYRGGHVPVILITAALSDAVAVAVEACGAVGHIRKPFDIEQVLDIVERHVGRSLGWTA